jgi:cell shape-determining protein MreC
MARSTPSYTPLRNYALGFFLSAFLLFSDISYGTFAPLRGFVHASNLYVQLVASSIFENINNSLSSFEQNKDLIVENKELKEQIHKMRTQDFIQSKGAEESLQIINLQGTLIDSLKTKNINIFKIASIDLRGYFCCSTHRIFLQNSNQVQVAENTPVFAGRSFIGQTKNTYLNFTEVILFSDTKHLLPIKSNFFYCDARGKGRPMLISCKLNQNINDLQNKIGDSIFTSGLGGVFLKDIEIGIISAINSISINEIEVVITLKTNPLEENFFGIIGREADEI